MAQVQTLSGFSPPGNLNELNQGNKTKWSNFISKRIDAEIAGGSGGGRQRGPLTQFFNGTVTAYNTGQEGATITWIGFPNKVWIWNFRQHALTLPRLRWRKETMTKGDGGQPIAVETFRMNTWNGLSSITMRATLSELSSPAKAQRYALPRASA
jgi:hypothetical protein